MTSVHDRDWQDAADPPVSERARRFVAPPLRGRHVHLRAVIPEDYTYLRLIDTSSELAVRWRLRGATPSPEDWARSNWSTVLAQFIIMANRDQSRVGQATVYDPNFQDGHAKLAAARFDPHSRSPLMILGVGLFIDYVFRCWNFRKLYMEVPEYNFPQLASGLERVYAIEGRLQQHYYLDGELWDQLLLAIYRDAWVEHPKRFLRAEQVLDGQAANHTP